MQVRQCVCVYTHVRGKSGCFGCEGSWVIANRGVANCKHLSLWWKKKKKKRNGPNVHGGCDVLQNMFSLSFFTAMHQGSNWKQRIKRRQAWFINDSIPYGASSQLGNLLWKLAHRLCMQALDQRAARDVLSVGKNWCFWCLIVVCNSVVASKLWTSHSGLQHKKKCSE